MAFCFPGGEKVRVAQLSDVGSVKTEDEPVRCSAVHFYRPAASLVLVGRTWRRASARSHRHQCVCGPERQRARVNCSVLILSLLYRLQYRCAMIMTCNVKLKTDSQSCVPCGNKETPFPPPPPCSPPPLLVLLFLLSSSLAPCGLQGCKNWPAPFPGLMSYMETKPGLALSVVYLSIHGIVVY